MTGSPKIQDFKSFVLRASWSSCSGPQKALGTTMDRLENWPWLGAHNPERATPIPGLCHSVFTDQFILRHILGHFFLRKQNLHHVYERIRSIRYQKGKLNVIKRQKVSFFGLWVLLTGLWNLKDIPNSRQNRSKNKLVCENAVTQARGSCSLRVMGSSLGPKPPPFTHKAPLGPKEKDKALGHLVKFEPSQISAMNDFPVIGDLVMRTGLWDRQGANIASRYKEMQGVELFLRLKAVSLERECRILP